MKARKVKNWKIITGKGNFRKQKIGKENVGISGFPNDGAY